MDRDAAARLVLQLGEVTTERGATTAEADVAQRKALLLTNKYGLKNLDQMAQARAHQAYKASRPTRTTTPRPMPADSWFDLRTGQAYGDTKVLWYQDPGNWRIEVPIR